MPSARHELTRRRLLGALCGLVLGAGCNARPGESPASSAAPSPTDEVSRSGSPTADEPGTGREATTPVDASLAGPWPTVGRDAANTAATDASGPTAPVAPVWTVHTGTVGTPYPAVGSHGVYAAVHRGTLVALDDAGVVRWRRALDDEVVTAPLVTADHVVVGTLSGTVTAVTPTGETAWTADLPQGLFAPHVSDGTVFAAGDGTVVLAHQREGLVAFDATDGTRRWTRPLAGRVHRPRVVDGTAYASTDPHDGDGAVVACSLDDGTERWRATVPRGASVAPTVAGDAVYAGTHRGLVLAFGRDGGERWRASTDDWVSTTPVVAAGAVWVGTLDGRLFAFERDGTRRATYDLELTTPVVDDGVLYAGGGERVVAFDAVGGERRWETRTDGRVRPPLDLADGRLYVGADGGDAYALDPADGRVQWEFVDRPATSPAPVVGDRALYVRGVAGSPEGVVVESGKSLWRPGLSGRVVGSPAVLAGGVLAGLADGRLTATAPLDYGDPPGDPMRVTPRPSPTETPIHVDLPRATRRWEAALDGTPTGGVGVADGVGFVPLGRELVRVDLATGTVAWRSDLPDEAVTVPAVAGDRVVVGGVGGVTALDATDGARRWHVDTPDAVRSSPAVENGTVAVGCDDGAVRALALGDGSERWRVETDGAVVSSPAVAADTVFVGSDDGAVRALALGDGSERWRVETDGAVRSSPAVAADTVFVGSRDRHLYALSATDGAVQWRTELDGWVDGAPAVAHGAVFVTDQSGACHCLATSTDG